MHKRYQNRRNWNGTGEQAIPRSVPPTECDRLDSCHGSGCHSDPQEDVPEICTKCHIKDTMDVMAASWDEVRAKTFHGNFNHILVQ